ncbi:hypothetical protein QQX98_007041 [Neonectria punicea]|uniref:Uncharacterized protein n=1 Tax=Neonectria punicea TaxID=979145 RepID=A0ABR1GZ38_9HYPO
MACPASLGTAIQFATVKWLFQDINDTVEESLTVSGVSVVDFAEIEENRPNGDVGEADSSGGPFPQRGHGQAWPTLVIESGHSQSLPEWWFGASDHQVKIVLLVKLEQSTRSIIIEKYVEVPGQIQPGAAATQAAAQLEPTCTQVITITDNQNPSNPLSHVTGGALQLEFDLLFLRQPGQGEGDIIVSIQRLQVLGECIWRMRRNG